MDHLDWQINKSNSECSKYILENEIQCDTSFKVGEDQEVIKAHRLILRMRSPVFDTMFTSAFQESENDPVIPDVSAAAFRTLLRYCYYECLVMEGDVALSVLYAATKYMLPILEKAARKSLIETLDSSIIWDVCKYSSDVGDEELYAGCITYLKWNLSSSNILDVIKYAATSGHEELNAYCRKQLKENLSKTNILDITKFVVSIGDQKLHATCKGCLEEHLCGSNIWDVYKYALTKGDTEVHQHCREYFERDVSTVREALQSEVFPNIEHEVLKDVLHINDKVDDEEGPKFTPGISISEIELFTSCNAWSEAECLRQEIPPTSANRRTVLGECLSLIRFPTMLHKDLATIVYPSGILTPAGIVNLGQYIHRDPGTECQVDFPSQHRQFVMKPSGCTSGRGLFSTVYIDSEVRVLLTRLWRSSPGSFRVSLRNEKSRRSWSIVVDAKYGNHVWGDTGKCLCYLDIEPPQVLEAGSRYSLSTEILHGLTSITKQPGVEYIMIQGKLSPYNEVKTAYDYNTMNTIKALTLSFV